MQKTWLYRVKKKNGTCDGSNIELREFILQVRQKLLSWRRVRRAAFGRRPLGTRDSQRHRSTSPRSSLRRFGGGLKSGERLGIGHWNLRLGGIDDDWKLNFNVGCHGQVAFDVNAVDALDQVRNGGRCHCSQKQQKSSPYTSMLHKQSFAKRVSGGGGGRGERENDEYQHEPIGICSWSGCCSLDSPAGTPANSERAISSLMVLASRFVRNRVRRMSFTLTRLTFTLDWLVVDKSTLTIWRSAMPHNTRSHKRHMACLICLGMP